jgi:hypothetical protein
MLYSSLFTWSLLSPAAHALGDDVLLYTGNSGFTYLNYFPMDTFEDVVAEEGCAVSVTEESSSFPTDLSDYVLVFQLLQSSTFTSSELTVMEDFMADGGVLILLGDTTSYDSGHVAAFNSTLSSFGAGSTFSTSASYDSGCSNTASAATSHALGAARRPGRADRR